MPRRSAAPAALVLLLLVGSAACAPGRRPPPNFQPETDYSAERDAIREVLRRQVAAWNAGDLGDFMAGYAQTDSLRFASGGTVRRGWQMTLERYQQTYPDRTAMGTLAFSDLDVRVLSDEAAYVFGRWRLTRAEDAPGGLFTLVFAQQPSGAWRIVHDHTSAAE